MTHPGDGTGHGDRRRATRFEVSGRLLGTIVSFDLPVRVRDLGPGGFSIETVEPIDTGELHQIRFTAIDDWTTVLPARSLHCRPSVASDGTPRYVTGFAFPARPKPDQHQRINDLVAKVTSIRLFDETQES